MEKVKRRTVVLGLVATSVVLPSLPALSVSAQGGIPDGVFVRESNGTVWLTLQGKRVAVPIWPAVDAEIQAIAQSGMWTVLSVNDNGAMVAGEMPAWYAAPQPPTRSLPPPAASALSAQPTTDGALTILEYTSYASRFAGSTFVAGLIENPSGSALCVKTIAVSLLGENGETVGGGSAIYKPTMLEAGTRAPWLGVVSNAPAFKEIRIQVESGPAQSSFGGQITHEVRLEGITAQPRRTAAGPKIVGQVVNTGSQTVSRVPVIGAVFTADSKLLDVNQAYSKLEKLAPGQSSPFEIDFIRDDVKDPSNYEVYTEARAER